MTRSGRGWAPFAEQVEGVTTYSSEPLHAVGFCDHTAQGFYSTLKSAAFWNNAGVSTHFGVARDGRVCQMVNLFETAWAQGRDSRGQPVGPTSPGVTWPPFAEMGKRNPNTYLISIEHEDAETVNGRTVFIPGSGRRRSTRPTSNSSAGASRKRSASRAMTSCGSASTR